jgi:hypothetical protein
MIKKSIKVIVILGAILIFLSGMIGCKLPEAPPLEEEAPPDEIVGGPGNPTIEFTYVPPYGSFENLKGQVWHVKPADYKVAVYIKVGSLGWWTKPYWSTPLTVIQSDGSWICDITTGGTDKKATEIVAFLVPNGYSPPSMSGGSTLPSELDENTLAKVITTRS